MSGLASAAFLVASLVRKPTVMMRSHFSAMKALMFG
jgi:hypothetical protein